MMLIASRLLLVVVLLVGASELVAQPVAPVTMGALNCPAGTLKLEGQIHWLPQVGGREHPGNDENGHLHGGGCIPAGQTLTGRVSFLLRPVLFQMPGRLQRIMVRFGDEVVRPMNVTCAGVLCDEQTYGWQTIVVDTTVAAQDGWTSLKINFRALNEDDEFQVIEIQASNFLKHGKALNSKTQEQWVTLQGWYPDGPVSEDKIGEIHGYQLVRFALPDLLPLLAKKPVSGIWNVRVVTTAPSVANGTAAIDPDLHHNLPGTVVDTWRGNKSRVLSIDTTKLSNGWHRLMVQADDTGHLKVSTRMATLGVLWFEARN